MMQQEPVRPTQLAAAGARRRACRDTCDTLPPHGCRGRTMDAGTAQHGACAGVAGEPRFSQRTLLRVYTKTFGLASSRAATRR
eukprot:scaffold33052_cov107-Isochrysis_galbana.AAC.2